VAAHRPGALERAHLALGDWRDTRARLARQQARTACAAALLRWIHAVITQQAAWDPAIAAGTRPQQQAA